MHFCLNGQGNQPELMSYVLVLLLLRKVQIKVVGAVPHKGGQLFLFFSFGQFRSTCVFVSWDGNKLKASSKALLSDNSAWLRYLADNPCQQQDPGSEFVLCQWNNHVAFQCWGRRQIFRFSVRPVVWIIQLSAGTSCLLIIDFFLWEWEIGYFIFCSLAECVQLKENHVAVGLTVTTQSINLDIIKHIAK